jgi:hypothetical protein
MKRSQRPATRECIGRIERHRLSRPFYPRDGRSLCGVHARRGTVDVTPMSSAMINR